MCKPSKSQQVCSQWLIKWQKRANFSLKILFIVISRNMCPITKGLIKPCAKHKQMPYQFVLCFCVLTLNAFVWFLFWVLVFEISIPQETLDSGAIYFPRPQVNKMGFLFLEGYSPQPALTPGRLSPSQLCILGGYPPAWTRTWKVILQPELTSGRFSCCQNQHLEGYPSARTNIWKVLLLSEPTSGRLSSSQESQAAWQEKVIFPVF